MLYKGEDRRMEKVTAIIVAGGSGKRMGMSIKKQYILLSNKEVLAHTIEAFDKCELIQEIILVVSEDEINKVKKDIVEKYSFNKVRKIVSGGTERQDSVYNGLLATSNDTKYVMIHDGARPFIKEKIIREALKLTIEKEATVVAVPVKDTIKVVDNKKQMVIDTPNRTTLWSIQTPQSFSKELLLKAYAYAKSENLAVTDDSMLVEAYGKAVYIVQGEYTNIKITTPEDLIIGEAVLKNQKG